MEQVCNLTQETPTPKENAPSAVAPSASEGETAFKEIETALTPPSFSFLDSQIEPSKVALAEKMGIPLGAIIADFKALKEWTQNTSQVTLANLKATTKIEPALNGLEKAMQSARTAQAQAQPISQPAPASQPQAGGDLLSIIMNALNNPDLMKNFSGGATDTKTAFYADYGKQAMEEDLALSKSIRQMVMAKTGAKVANDIVEGRPPT